MKYFHLLLLLSYSALSYCQDTIVEIGFNGPTAGMCWMADAAVGFGVKGDRDVVLTVDSGKTWTTKNILGWTSPYDINCLGVGSKKRAIVGLDSGGRTYVTEDGGVTWTPIKIGANKHVNSIQFIDSLNVYAVLNGNSGSVDTPYVYLSRDGGNNWEFLSKVNKPTWNAKLAFDKNEPNIMYLPLSSDDSLLYKSTDSARTWTEIPLPFNGRTDNFIYSFGDTSVYYYGGYDELFYSHDGGLTWNKKFKVPNVFGAKDFIFTKPDEGYMFSYYSGSYDSRLYKISNYGDSLELIAVEPNAWAYFFANSDTSNFRFHGNNGRVFTLGNNQIISSSTSLSQSSIEFFPNPSDHVLFIKGEEEITSISFHTLSGQLVLQQHYTEAGLYQTAVRIEDMTAGIYLVSVESADSVRTFRLVKK